MYVRKYFQGHGYLTFCSLMSWETNPAELGGGSVGQGTEGTVDPNQGPTSGYSEFASQILKEVPDEHKGILEPHLKRWDAGTTRRFQDLNNKYKHYDSLGWDEETTTQMAEVYRMIQEEPESLYEILKAEYGEAVTEAQTAPSGVGETTAIQGLPPEITQQLEQQNQVLQALAQWVIDQDKAKAEADGDKEFDGYIALLKTELGDFDEEYVHMAIANGMDGEAAVKQWQTKAQEILNAAGAATKDLPPAVLSAAGGGAVAQQEPQKLGNIDSKDIRALITNVLTQSNQAGQ